MEADKDVVAFSEAIFTYLYYTENLISSGSITETTDFKFELIAEVAKCVIVLSAFGDSSFNEIMDDYFEMHSITRLGAFTFISTLCFDDHEDNDDIFFVILNTLSFVYNLVMYCHNRGHEEYIDFGSMCWTEIFQSDLKEEFYAQGGWSKFKEYISDNRFVSLGEDVEKEALVEFLEEIDHLFPILETVEESEEDNFSC